jgi:hypothetical protein
VPVVADFVTATKMISGYDLQGKLGELLLSLCYDSNIGAITVEIIEARGLRAMDINGYSGK